MPPSILEPKLLLITVNPFSRSIWVVRLEVVVFPLVPVMQMTLPLNLRRLSTLGQIILAISPGLEVPFPTRRPIK